MSASPSNSVPSARQGFTLVEVLVSSFLTLIVMGMLFAVLMGTINAWESGTSRLNSSGDARLALDILKTDLESMVVRQTSYNQEWLSSRPFPDAVSGLTNTWLTFFAPSLDRDADQEGDIVAVSYILWYQDPISTLDRDENKIFGFYKAMTSTREAFENALDYGNASLLTENGSDQGYWTSSSPAPDPVVNDRDGFLAPNVVQFVVTWLVRKPGDTELTRVDHNHYVRLSNTLDIYVGQQSGSGGQIEAAEIRLTTITDEGMRRFQFLKKNGSASQQQLNRIIRETGRTHTLLVPINY